MTTDDPGGDVTIDNDERIQEVEHFIEEWPKMSGHGDVIYSVCTTAGEFSLRVPTLAALIELARAVEEWKAAMTSLREVNIDMAEKKMLAALARIKEGT